MGCHTWFYRRIETPSEEELKRLANDNLVHLRTSTREWLLEDIERRKEDFYKSLFKTRLWMGHDIKRALHNLYSRFYEAHGYMKYEQPQCDFSDVNIEVEIEYYSRLLEEGLAQRVIDYDAEVIVLQMNLDSGSRKVLLEYAMSQMEQENNSMNDFETHMGNWYKQTDDHDIFRVGHYPAKVLISLKKTIQYISQVNRHGKMYAGSSYLNDSELKGRLKLFWNKNPNGMIRFG